MKFRIFFLNLGLAAVLLASCTPQEIQPPAPAVVDPPQAATQAPENASQPQVAEAPVQAAPTSRGDKLEATDPATVNLASNNLQLVEFFRFT